MIKKIFAKDKLYIRVAIGFAVGILLGILLPEFSIAAKPVGDIYLKILKLFITPIVFCAVFCAFANIKDGKLLRQIGLRTVALYVLMFVVSSVISLGIAFVIRPGLSTSFANAPVYEGSTTSATVGSFFMNLLPKKFDDILYGSKTLLIIIVSIVFALICLKLGEKASKVTGGMNKLSAFFFKLLSWFMELSPIGVASLMAFSVAQYGSGIFGSLAKYIACCWICCIAVYVLVMLLPAVLITKVSAKDFLKASGKIALVTLSTTSSAATLPTTIKVSTEELGAPEDVSNFTLPLGCTINMCGGACSFCCLAVFVSDFYSLSLSLGTIVLLIALATIINMAAPGIPGGGIILGASFLSLLGMPIDLMGPISGFYRLLDMAFTTMNVEGDVSANLLIAKSVGKY